jgi:peptidoglycan/xylan/chitin deacetylase (PgdA/CDA1 family)
METDAVPILTYHSLDETGSVISTAPTVFAEQMRALKRWGFLGICLGDLLNAWEGKERLPQRPVVLTFDDGLQNVGEYAVPVLTDLGFRATIFAVAGYCGRTNDWPSQPARIPRFPLLSFAELRGLADSGYEIGAHGVVHAPLAMAPPKTAERELAEGKELLQDRLGQAVTVFAYPYGSANPALGPLVAAYYRGACGTSLGIASPSSDRYLLPRIDMHYYRTPSLFRLFPTRLGRVYLGLRALGRSCRRLCFGSPLGRVLQ